MRQSLRLTGLVLLAVGWGIGSARAADVGVSDPAPAEPPATPAQPPAAAAQPSPEELAVRKIEKLLASARDKMNGFQKEEFQLEMASIKSQGAALQAVKDPEKATEQIAKNAMTPELRAYRDAVLAAARAWQEFQQRYFAIGRNIKTLEREKPNAPAGLQADIDACAAKFNMKNRSLQMKVAGLYETVADYKSALAVLTAAYQEIPEEKRAAERDLKMAIAHLYEKAGDSAAALAAYKSILAAMPEEDRYKDRKLCEKTGDLYKTVGDLKNALDMYKKALAAVSDAKPAKGNKASKAALRKKIEDLEKKISTATPAVPASAPAAAKAPAK